jgi:homoserine kinase type II
MAVFTSVRMADLTVFLQDYALGDVLELKGIGAGIENSNYFLTTTSGQFVLTLFEKLSYEQLPYYIELMQYLAQRGVSCPEPQIRYDGTLWGVLSNKPALIATRLPGASRLMPTLADCAAIGAMQANMHLVAQRYPRQQPNLRGLDWWQSIEPLIMKHLTPEVSTLWRDELSTQAKLAQHIDYVNLPYGAVHADLFRDNVLFDDDGHPAVFDFYFAGHDRWLFDVAVTLNDWCIVRENTHYSSGELDFARVAAHLQAYQQIRPFTNDEHRLFPMILRAAAMRFWTSRLYDFYLPRPADVLKPHDPTHFERILIARREAVPTLAFFLEYPCNHRVQ